MAEKHVKIIFDVGSDNDECSEIESMWAVPHGNGYEIDNVPFYVKGIALGDIVAARRENDQLIMDRLVSASGHSTIRMWFAREVDVQPTRLQISELGCASEISDQPRLVAIDIPPEVNYQDVKLFLESGKENHTWDYQEACLGFL